MYPLALAGHSALRWVLLATALISWGSSLRAWRAGRGWHPEDEIGARAVMMLAFFQGVLGYLLLAELSPVTQAALRDLDAAMADPALRFFTLEHPGLMLLAFLVVAAGRWRTRDPAATPRSHRDWALALGLAGVLVLVAVPWPGLAHGRPLLRLP